MSIKKAYNIGDTVWIAGVHRTNSRLSKGKVIKKLTLPNYGDQIFYIICIPNEIEGLLEIRTWETISQDEQGPVGLVRTAMESTTFDAVDKSLAQLGAVLDEELFIDEDPTPAQIHAALERAQEIAEHPPLVISHKRPRKHYVRKKKRE